MQCHARVSECDGNSGQADLVNQVKGLLQKINYHHTLQEADILQCEFKWAFGNSTSSKASGGDGIPMELFQILKDDAVKVLHSICQQIWKSQQWPQDWKRSVFIPIPKKGNAKEGSNYCTIALISHASKVMLKMLQTRLQQYINHELPDVQTGFRKGRGTRDQIANIHWNINITTSLLAQMVKCLSEMWETWVQSLGWEDPLVKEMAIHSSTMAWKIPWMEVPGRLQSMELQRVRHD